MKIETLRVIYPAPTLFGGKKQMEDTSYYPTALQAKKAFAMLKKEPLETAIWINCGEFSYGYYFDSEDDAKYGKVTVKKSDNTKYSSECSCKPFSECKKEVYSFFE